MQSKATLRKVKDGEVRYCKILQESQWNCPSTFGG